MLNSVTIAEKKSWPENRDKRHNRRRSQNHSACGNRNNHANPLIRWGGARDRVQQVIGCQVECIGVWTEAGSGQYHRHSGHALLCSSARMNWQLRSAPLCTLRLNRSIRLRLVRPARENSPSAPSIWSQRLADPASGKCLDVTWSSRHIAFCYVRGCDLTALVTSPCALGSNSPVCATAPCPPGTGVWRSNQSTLAHLTDCTA